jgi:hypothetical protein
MAGSRLLTKILADFLFGFYLLSSVFKHATNHTQSRWQTFDEKLELHINFSFDFKFLLKFGRKKTFG